MLCPCDQLCAPSARHDGCPQRARLRDVPEQGRRRQGRGPALCRAVGRRGRGFTERTSVVVLRLSWIADGLRHHRIAGTKRGSPKIHVLARAEGLVVLMSSTNDKTCGGTPNTLEIVKMSSRRDPLPARDVPRPAPTTRSFVSCSSAERTPATHRRPPPVDDARVSPPYRPLGPDVGFPRARGRCRSPLIHLAFFPPPSTPSSLHLFASVVIDDGRFTQAAGRRRDDPRAWRLVVQPAPLPSECHRGRLSARSPCSPR